MRKLSQSLHERKFTQDSSLLSLSKKRLSRDQRLSTVWERNQLKIFCTVRIIQHFNDVIEIQLTSMKQLKIFKLGVSM